MSLGGYISEEGLRSLASVALNFQPKIIRHFLPMVEDFVVPQSHDDSVPMQAFNIEFAKSHFFGCSVTPKTAGTQV